MKLLLAFLTPALAASLVTLFVSLILESIFPHLVTATLTFDKLLQIVIFVGVCWALVSWQVTHFDRKPNQL